MPRPAAALLLAIIVGGAAAHADPAPSRSFVPSAVFGSDERRTLPQSLDPLREKIGVLNLGESSICTAFCISSDVIATASHCLLGTTQAPPPDLTRISFSVGGTTRRTSRLDGHGRRDMRARLSSGTNVLRVTPPIEAARDWAIARLEKPVCRSGGLTLSALAREAVEQHATRGNVYQVAMHRDFEPGTLIYAAPCSIARAFAQATETTIAVDFSKPEAVLMHTCDTGPGSSGSPLLIDGEGGPEVAGMNVGTYVLSRPPANTSSTGSPQTRQSEAIANTAIQVEEFRAAIEAFSITTSSLPARRKR